MAVDLSIAAPRPWFAPPHNKNRNAPVVVSALSYASSSSSSAAFPRSHRTCNHHHHHHPGLSTTTTRPSFKSYLAIDGSQSEIYENRLGGNVGEQHSPDLKTLVNAYKEAIRKRDEKVASEIEAMICVLENEKNELALKVEILLKDIASQKEKYIHTQADFDNFRKQIDKDRHRLTSNTQKDVLESLLPVVDNFEKAKQQIIPETEKGMKINTSYQSIYKQFVETLRSLRVSVVETVGKPFDPLVHEAIARKESQGFKEGIIIQEIRRGFLLGDRLLRPAAVIVSAGQGHKKSPITTKESEKQPTTVGVDGETNSNGNS